MNIMDLARFPLLAAADTALRHMGAEVIWHAADPTGSAGHDAVIEIRFHGSTASFPVEVKPQLRPATVQMHARSWPEGALIVTQRVTPQVAELLRGVGVNYIDASGNASIRAEGLHVEIAGRPPRERRDGRRSPLYSGAAMPVLLTLLCVPELVERPLRELQQVAGVSLGTVQKVRARLGEQDITDPPHAGNRDAWRRLLEGWVTAYSDGPRRDRVVCRATSRMRPGEAMSSLPPGGHTFSGEAAADLEGLDISPATLDLYLRSDVAEILQPLRARRDDTGWITIREPIWTDELDQMLRQTGRTANLAPGPVVYADLVMIHDPRTAALATQWQHHDPSLRPLFA